MPSTARKQKSTRNFAVETLVRTLRSYGVLTEQSLAELSGACCWPGRFTFKDALHRAVADNRISRLGDGLYEVNDPLLASSTGKDPSHARAGFKDASTRLPTVARKKRRAARHGGVHFLSTAAQHRDLRGLSFKQ